jgi:cation diffusion facilitator family transporter
MEIHAESLAALRHTHDYIGSQESAERRTRAVLFITLAMMVVEVAAGWLTGSMALLADGWHMGSHAAALGIAAFAYAFARRHAMNPRFTFGTGKVGFLGGYTSAVLLGVIALGILGESLDRLLHPVVVHFDQALAVAVLGLIVNTVCALILGHDHDHGEGHAHHGHHAHDHDHDHTRDRNHAAHQARHRDDNLHAAWIHVIADAVTSVTAIIALACGRWLGWVWMDPVMGVLGSILIARWSWGLLRSSGRVLLDVAESDELLAHVRNHLESDGETRVADLHVWRVGPAGHACIVSLVTDHPSRVEEYRARLAHITGLEHVTIEVNACTCEGNR